MSTTPFFFSLRRYSSCHCWIIIQLSHHYHCPNDEGWKASKSLWLWSPHNSHCPWNLQWAQYRIWRELCLHLAACLEAFKLSDFPHEPRKRQSSVKSLTKVELHCVSRMPHSGRFNWAQCDECHVWYRKEWTYQMKSSLLLMKFSGFAKFVIDFSIVHISLS